jgi:hypothetical protein
MLIVVILCQVYQMGGNANGNLNLLCLHPKRMVKCYNEYFINEYIFHTKEYGQGRKTYNSGVCVKGLTSNEFCRTSPVRRLMAIFARLLVLGSRHLVFG